MAAALASSASAASVEVSTAAVSVSTSMASVSISTPAISASTPSASLPGVSVSTPAAAAAPAEPPPAEAPVPPRPWVLGEITASGLKNVKFAVIKGEIKARKGDLYDRPDLDRDIQSLLSLGSFERVGADISSTGKAVPPELAKVSGSSTTVKLVFVVVEKPIIKRIDFKGNKKLSKSQLSDVIALKIKDPLDEVKLKEDEGKILDKYHEKGFLDATVSSTVKTDPRSLQSVVTYHVSEGPKSRIYWVSIHGAHAFSENKVRKQMEKNRRNKVYVEKDLADDVKKIETFYLDHGYLDVRVSSPTVLVSLNKERIYIDVGVQEGRPYRFGDTTFEGNTVYVSTELAKALVYRRGEIFNQEKYEDSIRAIQELYAEKGRLRARVSPLKTYNPKTDLMDVRYGLTEGDIVYIDHVDVEGNKATKTYVIRREVTTKPGDMFQASKIRKSREKIMNLGFIDDVDIDIESPTDPDKVDLTYDVTEGKPGMLTAGAAYSSLDGIVGTLSLQHMNLFGRAQRASIQWSFGKRVQDYSVSWTTPWVGNSPTSLGVDLFDTNRINPFESTLSGYTEHNVGATIRLGPRFQDDKYLLNFAFTVSRIGVTDINSTLPAGVLTPGTSDYSSASVEFARDTRDNIWDPTSGSRNSISLELAGGPLLGQINYFKPSIANAKHWELFDVQDYPFVLTLSNRGAYITPFGETKQVPVFNRFFLGGQDTLRGYAPTGEVGDPNGGEVYDVANLEFGFPLAREKRKTIVKLVTFFDAGGAWDSFHQVTGRFTGTDQFAIKSDAGIGIRFTTPAFPIRLDWGWGFNHQAGEKRYQINFGLGNLF